MTKKLHNEWSSEHPKAQTMTKKLQNLAPDPPVFRIIVRININPFRPSDLVLQAQQPPDVLLQAIELLQGCIGLAPGCATVQDTRSECLQETRSPNRTEPASRFTTPP